MERENYSLEDEQIGIAKCLVEEIGLESFLKSSETIIRRDDKVYKLLGDTLVRCLADFEENSSTSTERNINEIERGFYFAFGLVFSDHPTSNTPDDNLHQAADRLSKDIIRSIRASEPKRLQQVSVVRNYAKRGIKRIPGAEQLINLYEQASSPNPFARLYYTTGIGLALDLKAEVEEMKSIDDSVERLVPKYTTQHQPSTENEQSQSSELDEMDIRLWQFHDDSVERMKYLSTLEKWKSYAERNGALKSIYNELHLALEKSDFKQNNTEEYFEILEDKLLDGFAFGLSYGSTKWELGIVDHDTPELITTSMTVSKLYNRIGIVKSGQKLFDTYNNEAYELYENNIDEIFTEVSEYAYANILTDDGRKVFIMSAGIAIKLYDDAQELRDFKNKLYN